MYIKEIILDGFKSYSTRTSIAGFDPQFNAITGLNGSGKSNILDAICFVMGISTLKHIRVEKKQELIYKGGTAGVQRASVTLVFDNTNKAQSPPGYDDSDVINVNQTIQDTQSKFFINGRKETMEKVKNLFCSVKLNVNNPHFLIMQGRVTKVINMKPVELLGLIEEAAGTSLYQHKREQAQNHIRKKELKLQEIDNILKMEVTPKLEHLKSDKNALDEYKANVSQLERAERTLVAFRFQDLSKLADDPQGRGTELKSEERSLLNKISSYETKLAEVQAQLAGLEQRHRADDGAAKELQEDIQRIETEVFRLTQEIEAGRRERAAFHAFQSEQAVKKASLESKVARLAKQTQELSGETLATYKQELVAKKEQLRDAEDQCKRLASGEQDCDRAFLDNMIKDCQNSLGAQSAKRQQLGQEIKRNQRLRQAAQEELQRFKDEAANFEQDQEKIEKCLVDINARILRLPNNQKQQNDLKDEAAQLQQSIRERQERANQLGSLRHFVQFDYQIPPQVPNAQNFPHNQIYGRMSRLFTVVDVAKYGVAIQTIAGARLRHVVVQQHTVSRDLLQYKATRGQESFIPLNKAQWRVADAATVQKMKTLTHGKVELALDLLKFDARFHPALAQVFGQTFIAEDQETAKLVSLENPVRRFNCVTLQGDSYRTDGILSGGAVQHQPVLGKIEAYLGIERELIAKKNDLESLSQRMAELAAGQGERRQLEAEAQQEQRRLQLLKASGGEEARQKALGGEQKQQQFEDEDKELQQKLQECIEKEKKQEQEKKELEQQAELQKKGKGSKAVAFCEQRMLKVKKDVQELDKQIVKTGEDISKNELEIEQGRQELRRMDEKLKTESERMQEGRLEERQSLCSKRISVLEQCKLKSSSLDSAQMKISDDVRDKARELESVQQELADFRERRDRALEGIKTFESQAADAKKQVTEMLEQHKWIEQERQFFGQAGHMFDFKQMDIHAKRQSVKQLKAEIEEQKKRVNFKVDAMFDDTNSQYEKLLMKKETIEENKKQVEETIVYLNEKKNEELEKTWQIVNKNCSEIFSILLPGAMAKLVLHKPEEGVDQGLELKVGFNNAWKQSLSELSGGQRSLLALSLILALLRYQPAPLYILDEIDSALDLSHTQNIGLMIKKFFQNSQFLIVSLKEGLFQNANVLYKVQFLDNRSQVKRFQITAAEQSHKTQATGRRGRKKRAEDEEEQEEEEA